MVLLSILLGCSAFILWFCLCGYLIPLSRLCRPEPVTRPDDPPGREDPEALVCVIVSVFNEQAIIAKKIENLLAGAPRANPYRIFFVDGGSTDNTLEIIERATRANANMHLLRSPTPGKIQQLNHALRHIAATLPSASIIINTDADALLHPEAMDQLVRALTRDEAVKVAGANILPGPDAWDIELDHWIQQNRMRLVESMFHSASSAVAPCYGFKRELLAQFPDNCIADDLFTVYHANKEGGRVRFIPAATGIEQRVPASAGEYIRHKYRKSNACVREVIRFTPFFPAYAPPWRVVFGAKFLQTFIGPVIALAMPVISLQLLAHGRAGLVALLICWPGFFIGKALTTAHFENRLNINALLPKGAGGGGKQLITQPLTAIIIFISVVCYLFSKRDSCYTKLPAREPNNPNQDLPRH